MSIVPKSAQILSSSYNGTARVDLPNHCGIRIVFAVCPDSLCFWILVQIHVCDVELGVRKEKGGEGKISSLCEPLVYDDVFWKKPCGKLTSCVPSLTPQIQTTTVHTSAVEH